MCRLLHLEWRCAHEQTVWEFCRNSPPRRNEVKQPCNAFMDTFGPSPSAATDTEYRNHCCRFACCTEDQSDLYHQILALESCLGLDYKQRLPLFFRTKQEKNLKKLRKEFKLMGKRHNDRCEALYYGLGWVEGLDQVRVPPALSRDDTGLSQKSENKGNVRGLKYTVSERGVLLARERSLMPEVDGKAKRKAKSEKRMSAMSAP